LWRSETGAAVTAAAVAAAVALAVRDCGGWLAVDARPRGGGGSWAPVIVGYLISVLALRMGGGRLLRGGGGGGWRCR